MGTDYKLSFPIATGWFWNLQAAVRCIAPSTTGALFDAGIAERTTSASVVPLLNAHVLTFDHLALIGLVCCLFCGTMLPGDTGDIPLNGEAIRVMPWSKGQFVLI